MRSRLRFVLLAVVTALSACGSSTTPGGQTPGGAAVTLTIKSGDAQTAAPAAALPINPVVIARNASGTPVSGLTITFAVDSGGGSIATQTATTAADGTASPGLWTLGAVEGPNVLKVSATGATAIRLRATASFPAVKLIDNATVGTTGGVLKVSGTGTKNDGLTIDVPSGAYAVSTQWTIAARTGTPIPLPGGMTQVGSAIVVSNGQAMAKSPMRLTFPITATADTALAAFFYDPASGTLELIPGVARTATTYAVFTRHFTADRMFKARAAGASSRARVSADVTGSSAFGSAIIVLAAKPVAALNAPVTTSFAPGRDDWEFINLGTYAESDGICAGMTISAMYYHYAFAGTQGTLWRKYNLAGKNTYANPLGLRLATVVQNQADWQGYTNYRETIESYAQVPGAIPTALVYYQSIVLGLQTGRPQFLGIRGQDFGHAIIAFAASNGQISFADPNYPGLTRTMQFANNAFQPFPFSIRSNTADGLITSVAALGVSAIFDPSTLADDWAAVADSSIGRTGGYFPVMALERYDTNLTNKWIAVDTTKGTIITSAWPLILRTRCTTCATRRPSASADGDRQISLLIDSTGATLGDDVARSTIGAASAVPVGTSKIGIAQLGFPQQAAGAAPSDTIASWANFRMLKVAYSPVRLSALPVSPKPDSTVVITAQAGDLLAAAARLQWDFGDGKPTISTSGNATTHAYSAGGTYLVKVQLFDASNALIGKDSLALTVGNLSDAYSAWKLTPTSVGSPQPVPPSSSTDAVLRRALLFYQSQLSYWSAPPSGNQNPTFWFVKTTSSIVPSQGSIAPGLYLNDSLPGHGVLNLFATPDRAKQHVADDPVLNPFYTVTGNPPTDGALSAQYVPLSNYECIATFESAVMSWKVDFNMKGSTGTGTITYTFRALVPSCSSPNAVNSTWTLVVPFTAVRVG